MHGTHNPRVLPAFFTSMLIGRIVPDPTCKPIGQSRIDRDGLRFDRLHHVVFGQVVSAHCARSIK